MEPELSLAQDSVEGFTAAFEDLVLLLLDRLRRSHPKGQYDHLQLSSITSPRSLPLALARASSKLLLALRREVDEAIATTREMHNATVQINTLPHEIMSKVFRMDLEGMVPRKDKHRLGTAALVCRRWNRVILETPSLWSHWDQRDGFGYFKRAQGLSGATRLTISCDVSEKELWAAVSHERGRWEEVRFEVQTRSTSPLDALEDLRTGTAPKLRKLCIAVSPYYPLPRPLRMFAIEDPCPLEELRLSRVPIDWDAVNFSGLRVLEVGNLLKFGPTVRQILEILSRSNQLQHLALSGVTMSQESEPHPPLPPIVLPYLSTLKLRCGDDEAADIITGVSFPLCRELHVSGINWRRLSGLPILDVIGNIIRLGNTRVSFRENSLYLYRRDNSLRVRFRVGVQEAFRWLVAVAGPILNNCPLVTLVVEMKFDYEASMDILSTSSHLRNISALHLKSDSDGSLVGGTFLDCLANLGDQTGRLFPQLQDLIVTVSTTSEVESLRNFMARSYGSGLQLQAIRVAGNDTLLSQCKNLFQEIYTYLAGRELRVAGVHWKTFSQEH